MKKVLLLFAAVLLLCGGCSTAPKWTTEKCDVYTLVTQKKGRTLGYCEASGVTLLQDRGYAFKDLDRDGVLDPYEDWRLPSLRRAEDLASKLSIEEIAGLMLYSSHQAIPTDDYGPYSSPYNGTIRRLSGLGPDALSDAQKKFLSEDGLRAVLIVRSKTPGMFAAWNNNAQAFCEGIGHGIPVNISSDPRNELRGVAEFNAGSGGSMSIWPIPLGLAATFDPSIVREYGSIAAKEYRALGIGTALSPQADLATDPRWTRDYGTFGEDAALAADMVRAYIDGFQTSPEPFEKGWGYGSVNAMVKHWPGGGTGEGGRDAHYGFGKYSVYPANNLQTQLIPFLEGAFKLSGGTSSASAVMPYYTISYCQDPSGHDVANGFSSYIVGDLLRARYEYDGVVCTDWGVTWDEHDVAAAYGKPWGVENLSIAERHFQALKAGVDQFGGNNDAAPVLEAYRMWAEQYGQDSADERFRRSAVRLLLNEFRIGLFDNPYVNPGVAEELVGCEEFMQKGYSAQQKSLVMAKNHCLPFAKGSKVYLPKRYEGSEAEFLGSVKTSDKWEYPIDTALVGEYFKLVSTPDEADFALVSIQGPKGSYGYSSSDRDSGGNGYTPISLQYSPYTASTARAESLAGGDPYEDFTNRSYRGKSTSNNNYSDLQLVADTRAMMGSKPVVVAVETRNPFVPSELEPLADALLLGFTINPRVYLDVASGEFEPSGLLPIQMPSSMETVEAQAEDLSRDMTPYIDSDGHLYDFAYGLNWSGVIDDERVKKYK